MIRPASEGPRPRPVRRTVPEECFRDLVVLYLLRELTADEARSFERHAWRCPDCQKDLAGLRKTDCLLRRWAASAREAPPRRYLWRNKRKDERLEH